MSRYLIISPVLGVTYADQFDPERHSHPDHPITVIDLRDNLSSTDGRHWTHIGTIDLDQINWTNPAQIKDGEIGISMALFNGKGPGMTPEHYADAITRAFGNYVNGHPRSFMIDPDTGERYQIPNYEDESNTQ